MINPARLLLSLLPLVILLSSTASARALATGPTNVQPSPPRRFALVIGSNATLDSDKSPLRFADDDAARMAELLAEIGVDVELVTNFDRESQQVFGELVDRARPATKRQVMQAFEALLQRMHDAARAAPGSTELLIYYSGHGDVGPDGQGYLVLQRGKLSRHDLFHELLRRSPADYNHVVVDACRSEQFVLSRGDEWRDDRAAPKYGRAVRHYLERRHLGAFPNTGVLLAHSVDQQTHEWSRYRGGIFTHELLSGLRGGADLNGDGAIEYSELAGFVAAANSGVDDPRARLQVVARPPKTNRRKPILAHADIARQRVLFFPDGSTHRYTVEDARGVRLADVHRSAGHPAYLRLPRGPMFVYEHAGSQATGPRREARIPGSADGLILANRLEFHRPERASRGALDQAFRRGLFAVPYGPEYYAGYADTHGMLKVADPKWRVTIWERTDGELVEVTRIEPEDDDEEDDEDDESSSPAEAAASDVQRRDQWDVHVEDWPPSEVWGSISVGTVFTPFVTEGDIRHPERRFTGNQADPWFGPVRGIDLRWNTFWIKHNRGLFRNGPRTQWYFRTGYTRGRVDFLPEDEMAGFETGHAVSMDYLTVPLFLGGNVYLFKSFPVRPFAGLGFGFDILRVHYERWNREDRVDVSARIGFELHAGIEIRLTNYVTLTGEIMQLWSARRRINNLPDYSNERFTVMAGIAIGFPLHKRAREITIEHRPRRSKATNDADEDGPVELKAGDNDIVVEREPSSPAVDQAKEDEPTAETPPDASDDADRPPPELSVERPIPR